MKVTLSKNYADGYSVSPNEHSWTPEYVVEMSTEEVLKILEIQVKMEALNQRLKPMFEACEEKRKVREEAEKAAKEEAVKTAADMLDN